MQFFFLKYFAMKINGVCRRWLFDQNNRITQLGKSGRIEEAFTLFDSMQSRNTVTWNSIISACAKSGDINRARHLFDVMPSRDRVSWNSMIAGYSHNGLVAEASRLFDRMPTRDVFSWTIMITCLANSGHLSKARFLFDNLNPDIKRRSLAVSNAMVTGYAKNGFVEEARKLLEELSVTDCVTWNSVLSGYTQNGAMTLGLEFFEKKMKSVRDLVSWNLVLDGFVRIGDLSNAQLFFDQIPEKNSVSFVTMINGYAKNRRMVDAKKLFDEMPDRNNIVSWNVMIAGYVENSDIKNAHKLFSEMPGRNSVSWTAIITGFVRNGDLRKAQQLLDEMPYKNVGAQTAMLQGYVSNEMIEDARVLFEHIGSSRDVMCWNTMIAGYVRCRRMDEALELFDKMPFQDVVSSNTMITGYAHVQMMEEASRIFHRMSPTMRSRISWNSLISGFVENGFYLDALLHLTLMMSESDDEKKPDSTTLISGFAACASLASLRAGSQLHCHLTKSGDNRDLSTNNALINMYSKCGMMSEAQRKFNEIPNPDVITWNSLIGGYACNGQGGEAVSKFESMIKSSVKPDEITFVEVLSACSHAGMFDTGIEIFDSLTKRSNTWTPVVSEHYTCMVDLLGRAGRLTEAYELITKAPHNPTVATWGALLRACRIHRNPKLGKIAAENLTKSDPQKPSNYVQLSNMLAELGRWKEVEEIRTLISDIGIEKKKKKNAGCSWIEIDNHLHVFITENRSKNIKYTTIIKSVLDSRK